MVDAGTNVDDHDHDDNDIYEQDTPSESSAELGTGAATGGGAVASGSAFGVKRTMSGKGVVLEIGVEEDGNVKRTGGIGDVLAGVVTLFCSWQALQAQPQAQDGGKDTNKERQPLDPLFAMYLASAVVKRASRRAENQHKRGLSPVHIVDELAGVCEDLSPLR